jgi:hypothetical protein
MGCQGFTGPKPSAFLDKIMKELSQMYKRDFNSPNLKSIKLVGYVLELCYALLVCIFIDYYGKEIDSFCTGSCE